MSIVQRSSQMLIATKRAAALEADELFENNALARASVRSPILEQGHNLAPASRREVFRLGYSVAAAALGALTPISPALAQARERSTAGVSILEVLLRGAVYIFSRPLALALTAGRSISRAVNDYFDYRIDAANGDGAQALFETRADVRYERPYFERQVAWEQSNVSELARRSAERMPLREQRSLIDDAKQTVDRIEQEGEGMSSSVSIYDLSRTRFSIRSTQLDLLGQELMVLDTQVREMRAQMNRIQSVLRDAYRL